ncbi:tautomerase family protein [Nostoc sp.]|uniref:tautomerase family protein n=1 Tax=Nostoc sp. TaxID=1180 RepID=UPI002FF93F81
MPMWQIYHHEDVFTNEEKLEMSQLITGLYPFLPRFYVNVHFHDLSKDSFYNGGEVTKDLVSIQVDHVARQMIDDETQKRFVQKCKDAVEPIIKRHNLRWEFYIDQTPTELWLVDGLVPPDPDSDAEKKWKRENRATPY